ncbi:hypothetical protein BCR39DRAFT_591257 [Naematelia encephala]|uniref:Uncharacterized protein n=1 Tax=Naematelia encephala TaxID=71784 RepID=A0A1Y2AJ95_9TREE|nr:hypothetical protein BCR39DRAFT_591257 [Naematelia encephala]
MSRAPSNNNSFRRSTRHTSGGSAIRSSHGYTDNRSRVQPTDNSSQASTDVTNTQNASTDRTYVGVSIFTSPQRTTGDSTFRPPMTTSSIARYRERIGTVVETLRRWSVSQDHSRQIPVDDVVIRAQSLYTELQQFRLPPNVEDFTIGEAYESRITEIEEQVHQYVTTRSYESEPSQQLQSGEGDRRESPEEMFPMDD